MDVMDALNAENIANLLGVVGILVSVVALAFHTRDIRRATGEIRSQSKKAREHTKKLGEIEHAMSTRYIGPDFLPEIVGIIENAKERVVIFCDFPAYGSFAEPDNYLRYARVIEDKILEGVTVELTYLKPKLQHQYMRERFPANREEWNKWKGKPENKCLIDKLLQAHGRTNHDEDLNLEDFVGLIDDNEAKALSGTFGLAKKFIVDSYMPIYCWIVDDNKAGAAVFSLPSLSPEAFEHGFITRDTKLITALAGMRDGYHPKIISNITRL